jgi:hypothetical protein
MKVLLHKHFTREGEHHIAKAKHHRAIAEHAGKVLDMHKAAAADMEGLDELLQSYIDEHAAVAAEHADYATHCLKCAKACSTSGKAAGMDDDLDALIPSSISGVAPDVPPNIRAVARFGSPAVPSKADATVAKIFGTDEVE